MTALEYGEHDEYYQEGEFSKEPDVVWTGIGRKIPVIVFYASVLDLDLKERYSITGNFRLTFKTGKTDCKIVRSLLQAHGFVEVHPSSSHFNLYWTGSHVKPYDLRCYGEYQKVNHFPRSYEITRKDRMVKNVQRMQQTKGFKTFNFIPKTYVIPEEYHQYIAAFTKEQGIWIVKPIASSRGRGIFLVNHPSQIPTEDPMVVSKYIDNPLCIDGFKFDVRLYVAVTSYYPLRIYLYEEGLTRFATVRYNGAGRNLHNQRMHLTNYSINKRSIEYVRCEDPTIEDYGNKWSMSAMLRFLEEEGKDVAMLMSRVEDVVIKTIISGELPIAGACKAFMNQKINCFEIYGFDILIDENLYPWLLEVNLSPSLACDAPLDFRIKSNLVADLLTLAGVVVQDTYSGEVKRKQKDTVAECKNRVKPILSSNLDNYKLNYTAENMRTVREAREEFEREGKFVRIFPRVDTWDLYGAYLEHKAINYTLHCQLFPDRIKSRSVVITRGRLKSQHFREQVSLPEVNLAALHMRMDQYKRVLTIKLKQKDTIPLRMVICRRPSHTGLEGAATLQQSTITAEKKSESEPIAQCQMVKSEAIGGHSTAAKKLVGNIQQVNPELLSKIQARHVFAAYLEHVQRRLIKETSYTEEKFQHDSDQADIDLIVKFLRKAASNLRGNFRIIEPSLCIPVRDRCRILAKQLADFVALYKKETIQYEHREKMYGVYMMKNPKQEVSENQFHLFIKEANESVLEKTLVLYTKANRATNAFLSAAYPTASQENESESASVPGSVHSSCTSLVGSEASRHITGQSSDSSESECLSDPPAVKTSVCQSRKLCRTLSSDPSRRKTTSLRDSKPSSGSNRQNYSQPQTVLNRSISPLSSLNTSNSRSNLHSTGMSEQSQTTVSPHKQTKPEPRPVLGRQLNQESISVALTKLARKQNSRKYSATLATKVGIHSKSLINPERNTPLHLAEVTTSQGEKYPEEVTRLNSQFFVPTNTRTGSQGLLRSQSKIKKDIVQVQSFSDVSTDVNPMSPSSDQQLRLQAHARAIAHQYLLQKKQSITGKDHAVNSPYATPNKSILYPTRKW